MGKIINKYSIVLILMIMVFPLRQSVAPSQTSNVSSSEIVLSQKTPITTQNKIDKHNTIIVNTNKIIKPVNKKLFGVALEKLYREYWEIPINFQDPDLINILNELKPTVASIFNTYLGLPFYKESTGEPAKRLTILDTLKRMNVTQDPIGKNLYSEIKDHPFYRDNPPRKNYDDMLQFLEGLNMDICLRIPVIFTDQGKFSKMRLNLDPKTGADLVHYLNDPPSTELGAIRAANRHPEPYKIKYFVLGNEFWSNHDCGGDPNCNGFTIEQITSQYKAFSQAMKKADPNIKIGINLVDDAYPHEYLKPVIITRYQKRLNYNGNILREVKNDIDFVTYHVYGIGEIESQKSFDTETWKYFMAQNYLKKKNGIAQRHKEIVNKYNNAIKIAIDEYSGHLLTLGGALYNVDYILYMLNNDYLFANVWSLGIMNPGDKVFGLIKTEENIGNFQYIKRPNFYALKLFTNYFGDSIVESRVESSTFNTRAETSRYFNWPADKSIPSLEAIASIKGNKLFLLVINRELKKDLETSITLNDFIPNNIAKVYTLNGPSIDSTNEKIPDNVRIRESTIDYVSNSFTYNFEKHSVTVLELNLSSQ